MDIRIIEILKKISDKQYKAYLVGGSSRDYLLNKEFTDIDIATNAPISFLEENFEIVSLTGKCFGSLKINYKNLIAEITLFRQESYDFKSIYPHIEKYVNSLQEDYLRRDLTINAIYIDYNLNVYDPSNGLKDLRCKRLRFINNPDLRIKEDPTRIFRIIKFQFQLGFKIPFSLQKVIKNNHLAILRLSKDKYEKEINSLKKYLNEKQLLKTLKKYKINYNKKGD